MPDVVTVIYQELMNDDYNETEKLTAIYDESDKDGKDLIDRFLIALCGWAFESLQELATEREIFV